MRQINKIIIHCSASDNDKDDSVARIEFLHTMPDNVPIKWGPYYTRGKAFSEIGYHYIITRDGIIRLGRGIEKAGAHCKGENKDSIGICVVGNKVFGDKQFESLHTLVHMLLKKHSIHPDKVYPHKYFNRHKGCPNFEIADYFVGSKEEKLGYDEAFFEQVDEFRGAIGETDGDY
jgi:N-acetylmuramoyl-L-alanine amidase